METLGGQALVEGVMVISPKRVAFAVRTLKNSIKIKVERRHRLAQRYRRVPFVRGALALWEMLALGTKGLMWSADQSTEDKEEKLSTAAITWTIIFSFVFGILLFVAVPFYAAKLITGNHWLFNILDGIFRIAMFLSYLLIISRMKDVKRLFQYHGAEHMAIHCYEHKKKLTKENVMRFTTLHPRCGTAFLFIVLLLSIFLFSLIYAKFWLWKFLLRIAIMPVIAIVSYELLKLGARFPKNLILRALVKPGLWFQKITTRQPDEKQIEVAIASVKAVLR